VRGDEDVKSLAEGDFDALVELMKKRIGDEKSKKLLDR
jgi:hypothetical protein